jgi:transcriptional regulator with XRE-family HTH domain
MIASMVTHIRKTARARLFIAEWIEHRGLSDEKIANRIGVARETVWKWRNQPRRLDPDKLAALALALDIEPEELWRPPHRVSLDALVKDAPDDLHATAADIVRRLVGRAS